MYTWHVTLTGKSNKFEKEFSDAKVNIVHVKDEKNTNDTLFTCYHARILIQTSIRIVMEFLIIVKYNVLAVIMVNT